MSKKSRKNQGFTIVELLLAMSLLGFIMVFTITVLSQMVVTYNRGLTLVQINQAIRQLDNDVAKGLKFTGPGSLQTWSASDGSAGALCASGITYVWNTGVDSNSNSAQHFKYSSGTKPLRLARIENPGKNYCDTVANTSVMTVDPTSKDVTNLLGSQAMVLRAVVGSVTQEDFQTGEDVDTGYGLDGGNDRVFHLGRLVNVHFILSSASSGGNEFTAVEVDDNNDGIKDRWTCETSKHKGEFCSFGEFNSTIYMRGQ